MDKKAMTEKNMTEKKGWSTDVPKKNFNDYVSGTQRYNILNHLQEKKYITALEALSLYRIFRLAARICDMRDDGYTIDTIFKTDITGKRYAQYKLL